MATSLVKRPLEAHNIQTPTRVAFPPMATWSAPDGTPTAKTVEHYRAVAKNPLVGLVFVEYAYTSVQGKAADGQLSASRDADVEPLAKLARAVHDGTPGTKAVVQVCHAGANTTEEATGQQPVGPSAVDMGGGMARPLRHDELAGVVDDFAAAALRVKRAGFDGVELHSAHGYLLDEFFSPLTNKRDDEYGPQSVENRTRLLRESIRAVRQAVGDDFFVGVRFGGVDFMPGGSVLPDAVAAAPLLAQAGADMVDVSGGLGGFMKHDSDKPCYFSEEARAVRAAVDVPVMVTGGVRQPSDAEQVLARGDADVVGVGRALYRDPAWGSEAAQE